MRDAPPLRIFFKTVLAELKKRLSPKEFTEFVEECEKDSSTENEEEVIDCDSANDIA